MGHQASINVKRFHIEVIAEKWKELFESVIKKGTHS